MKHSFFTTIFVSASALLVAGGCAEDTPDLGGLENGLNQADVSDNPPTRAGAQSFDTGWENMEKIRLANGDSISLPWGEYAESSHGSAFLKDMRREDGWELVTHNLYEQPSVTSNNWKIAFYNQASGDLKVYSYWGGELNNAHNNAYWTVRFSNAQGWFNGLSEVTVPTSKKTPYSFIWKTSVQPNETNNFVSTGWNVIVVPNLTYDPSAPSANIMEFDSYAATMTHMEGFGETTGSINGKVISFGGDSGNTETKISSYLGNGAKNWVTSHMSGGSSIIAKGVAGLVKSGVQKILGGLFGWTSKPGYTEKTVRLNIKADSKFDATLVTLSGTGIPGGKISFDRKESGVELGNWNLSDNPTIYIHPVGVLYNTFNGTQTDDAEYTYAASGAFKADIVINPQLRPHIKSYKVECFPVRYISKKGGTAGLPELPEAYRKSFTYGGIGSLEPSSSFRGLQPADTKIYEDNDYAIYDSRVQGCATYWQIWNKYGKASGPIPLYKYIYGPSNNDICRGGSIKLDCIYNYVKVLVTMEVEFEGKAGTVISSRTYRPKFEWDPALVKQYSTLSMSSLQGFAEGDYILDRIDNGCYDRLRQGAQSVQDKADAEKFLDPGTQEKIKRSKMK